jgi:hypothetical protein
MLKKPILMLVLLLIFTSGWSNAQEATPETSDTDLPQEVIALFDYDQTAPLGVQEVSSEARGDVTIKDITYPSPAAGRPDISAYLVLPAGEGPFPAVLYVHWYERNSPTANRTQFLDEAVTLAQEGVVSLLVSTMWSESSWYVEGRTLESDYDDAVHQVVELRRGLDVLVAQPQVDATHIAFVGHDFGAMYGALMGGVDHRAMAYVLIAGVPDFNEWMLFGVDENREGLDDYRLRMATLAPSRFVANVTAEGILFQFGTEDFYTPQDSINNFFSAAPTPKQLGVYASEHAMVLPEIQADRLAFLRLHLDID